MVSKESTNSLGVLLWLLIIIAVVIIAAIFGAVFSGDGEIQAPGAERGSVVEIV